MSKQTSAHEPTTVPQSTYQKYQEEVRPEHIQSLEQSKEQYKQPTTKQPTQPSHPEYEPSQTLQQQQQFPSSQSKYQQSQPQYQPSQSSQYDPYQSASRRTKFQQGNVQINISDESVQQINQLINIITQVDYDCHSIAYYFDRADIGLYGVADFFRNCGLIKCRKVKYLMDYLMVRGARVILDDVNKPVKKEWGTPVEALEYYLSVQKKIYEATLKVYQSAQKINDAHLTDFLEEYVLRSLSLWVRRIAVIISNAEKAGPTLGVYQLNKHLCYNMKLFFETDKEITSFLEE